MAKNLLDVAVVPFEAKTHKYGTLKVYGLSIQGIAHIIKNHPDLFEVFDGAGSLNMEFKDIMVLGVDVCAEFLAAGLGYAGEEKAVQMCKDMNAEDAMTVGTAIFNESFPGGATNFFERVAEVAKSTNLLQPSKVMGKSKPLEKKKAKTVKAS